MEECIKRLAEVVSKNHDKTFIHDLLDNRVVSYGEFFSCAIQFSKHLRHSCGITKDDKIAMVLPNSLEALVTYFGCIFAEATVVPFNIELKPTDLKQILELANIKYTITNAHTSSQLDLQRFIAKSDTYYFEDALAFGHHLPLKEITSILSSLDPNSLSQIMFTSGTTSLPKGVPITFKKILANGSAFCDLHKIDNASIFYNILPVGYLGGLYNLFLIPLLAGGTIVLDAPFGPTNIFGFWDTVKNYQINTLWFSPTMISMLLEVGMDDDFDRKAVAQQIRLGLVGMAPCPPTLKQRFLDECGIVVYENYGLSETFFIASQAKDLSSPQNSVGQIFPNVEVKIESDTNEILVRSPYAIDDYLTSLNVRMPKTEEGFFKTGDVGEIDSSGNLYVTGRLKDLIIRGGINISPLEIEDVLLGFDGVDEVAVIGSPHPIYGEVVVAAIKTPRNGTISEKDLFTHCTEHLANLKVPARFEFLDEMPKNSSGKIDKKALKERLDKDSNN